MQSPFPWAAAVAVAVVGQEPFDGDATFGEPPDRSLEERDAVNGVLGASELGIRESAVGVDRSMDVRVADPLVEHRRGATMDTMAPTGWDPSEFLHVDVHELPGA